MSTKNRISFSAFALAAAFGFAGVAKAATFSAIDLKGVANTNPITAFTNGASFPNADTPVILDGVPYLLPSSGNYIWHSSFASGSNPLTVDIAVGVFGVDKAYTLMGTYWGETTGGTFAAIEFFGSGGAHARYELDGGKQIRDFNFNPSFTTTLDPVTTKEVWSNGTGAGTQHLDRQLFDLPTAFETQTLTTIRVTDSGGTSFQRTFIAAATVSAVPEPEIYALFLAGLGLMGAIVKRRKSRQA